MTWWKKRHVYVTNLKERGVVGQPVEFNIDASRAGKSHPEVVINDGSTPCVVVALGQHRYHASFTPQEARRHFIQLQFRGRNLPKDPYMIDILPCVSGPSPQQVTVSGPGLQQVAVNQLTSFNVCTGDRQTQVLATIKSPSGCQIEHYILDKDDGTYVVEYTPSKIGTYTIEVTCDGRLVSGKSFSVDANYPVVVSTVSSYFVGKTTEFEIDTFLAGDGDLEVTILSRNDGTIPSTTTVLQTGLYLVTFTPLSLQPTYAQIFFNSDEVSQSPVRLDSQTSEQLKLPRPSATTQSLPAGGYRSHQPRVGYSTTSVSSLEDSVFRDDDVHDYENVPQSLRRDVAESGESAGTSVCEDKEETYKDAAQRHPGIREDIAQRLDTLQACLKGGIQHVYLVRQGLVADVFELYKHKDVAGKTLSVEFLGEPGVDYNGLTRELFATFWRQVAEDLFRGEDCLVPDLALYRIRKESWKFECLGRILSHTVALTGTIPSIFAKSTLVKFTTNDEVDDKCLLEDFLLFITTRERTLLTKAMSDFSGLTEAESDRQQNFFTAHGFNNTPKGSEIKEQILTIAYQDLVEKPGSLISKMRQGIPESHKAAFWQELSADDITHILQAQRPTPEKVADVIMTTNEDMTDDEDRTLYFLKEFVASLDFDTLTDFLIFVTGSVHQPDKISVTFTTLTGLDRRPISHTCFNQLEIPTSYSSIKEFKREFLSVLASSEAFQYSEI